MSNATTHPLTIAFLGLGRMGTELALKLVDDHQLTVWNRTKEKTQALVDKGACAADTPAEAVAGADLVITSLFGPDTVREVVIKPNLIPEGVTWADTTTVSPADADEFARAVEGYVHAPVVGTLTPARNGKLGVFVGGTDASRRTTVAEVVAPWAAANPERLKVVDSGAKAATGKLLANLALAVTAQGYKEALYLGESQGLDAAEVSDLLGSTGLEFMRTMKQPFVLGERETSPGDFTVDAIAKDARLMLDSADQDLPAVRAALDSLEGQQEAGRGDHDFSSLMVYRNEQG
ncbi:NAD(P)-dependent oxidoreductase [Corynebacterium cystitidis]|uniref:NAD(P)-dependent oxidoreductase n=1 Tax=Corynebacterium cystitidis TaxID=35757 RepID=UPI00211E7079|nr:NAD(P)-dependent oxidoreductase [Corynebacterium cystitidis]